jgi:hypothetical protein
MIYIRNFAIGRKEAGWLQGSRRSKYQEEEMDNPVKWVLHFIHHDGTHTEHLVEPGQSVEVPESASHVLVPVTASGQPIVVAETPVPEEEPETPSAAPESPAPAPEAIRTPDPAQ